MLRPITALLAIALLGVIFAPGATSVSFGDTRTLRPYLGESLDELWARGHQPGDVRGAVETEDGWYVPLAAATPPWLPVDAIGRLMVGETLAATAPRPMEVETSFTGPIAPGSMMLSTNAWCTLNFVYRERATGALGMGTAGHCIEAGRQAYVVRFVANPAGSVQATPTPPPLTPPDLTPCAENPRNIGHDNCILAQLDLSALYHWEPLPQDVLVRATAIGVAEFSVNTLDAADDFALIRLHPHVADEVETRIKVLGGPCGAYQGALGNGDANAPMGVALLHYGHGHAVGTGGTLRAGIGVFPSPTSAQETWIGAGTARGGDSGAPVRAWVGEGVQDPSTGQPTPWTGTGGAVGILTQGGTVQRAEPLFPYKGPTLAHILASHIPGWDLEHPAICPHV